MLSIRDLARILPAAVIVVFFAEFLYCAELSMETARAWDRYYHWADDKVRRELADPKVFLIQNGLPPAKRNEVRRSLESGKIYVDRMTGIIPRGAKFEVPDGDIHHWWGTVLIRNVTLEKLMVFLQDYNNHAGKFADIERSRILDAGENRYKVYFRFRRSKAFITAVFNTEQDCLYASHAPGRMSSQSIATRIAEVEDPGEPTERERKPGNDRGILWRLASWWRYEQRGRDVMIEIESASLSRDIPWAVNVVPYLRSYIRSTPRESLEAVLASIRAHMK